MLFPLSNTMALISVIGLLAALGFWVDHTSLGKKIPGVIITLLAALLLANIGVIPHRSEVYDTVWRVIVPLAIPMLLMGSDLRAVSRQIGNMLAPFSCAVVATIVGALFALLLIDLGEHSGQLAAIFTATYIGGSLNFVAVSKAVGLEDGALLASAMAVDTLAGTFFLAVLIVLPASPLLRKWLIAPEACYQTAQGQAATPEDLRPPLSAALQIVVLIALSAFICGLAQWLAEVLGVANLDMLFMTLFSVAFATLCPGFAARLQLAPELGMAFMFAFFVVISASANVTGIIQAAPMMLLFVSVILISHIVLMAAFARLFGFDMARLIIASNACVLGPPAAAAVAAGRGWHGLISPGLVCGILGYIVANFLGVLLYRLLL